GAILGIFARAQGQVPVVRSPRRRGPIDGEPVRLRDPRPWIDVAGVEPAASEIEWQPFPLNRPCASADARSRLDYDEADARLQKPPARRNTGGAGTDDDNVNFIP